MVNFKRGKMGRDSFTGVHRLMICYPQYIKVSKKLLLFIKCKFITQHSNGHKIFENKKKSNGHKIFEFLLTKIFDGGKLFTLFIFKCLHNFECFHVN